MTEALVIASRGGAVGPALIEAASTTFDQSYLRPLRQYTSKEAQQELARESRAILNLELDQAFAIVAALELGVSELPPPDQEPTAGRDSAVLEHSCPPPAGSPHFQRIPARKEAAARRMLSPRECSILRLL